MYLVAFWELSSDRQVGMAAGPIMFSSIDTYARRYMIDDPEEFELLVQMIRVCDKVFLNYTKSKE